MGNSLFRCCCTCCMNSTEEHRPLLQQKSVYYGEKRRENRFVKLRLDIEHNDDIPADLQAKLNLITSMLGPIEDVKDEMNKSDEKSSEYYQLPTEQSIVPEKQNNIIEFNDYDDIVNINNDLLLIFGFIRAAQNNLSSDIAHHIIPQSVINIICNYCQKPTLSIFKTKFNFIKDKPSMCIAVERIACNVKKLFINGSSLFFLSTNEHIYVFGSNQRGKLGIVWSTDWSGTVDKPRTTTFYQKHRFKLISSSSCISQHSIAVTLGNDVYGYGYNGYYKRFGAENPSIKNSYTAKGILQSKVEVFWPTLINIKYKIIDIRLGAEHSLFLTNNGKVLGCGENGHRQLGIDHFNVEGIQLINSLLDHTIIQIRCGYNFSLVLTESGILKGFGSNNKGELGIGAVELGSWGGHAKPVNINVTEDDDEYIAITTMECGSEHACCLDANGNVYCWGNNENGQCGQYTDQFESYTNKWGRSQYETSTYYAHSISKPIRIEAQSVTHIACSSNYTAAMDHEMNLYGWGDCDQNIRFSNYSWNNRYVDEKKEQSRIHVAKYSEFKHLIDGKQIIDIKAGGYGDIYLCVANH